MDQTNYSNQQISNLTQPQGGFPSDSNPQTGFHQVPQPPTSNTASTLPPPILYSEEKKKNKPAVSKNLMIAGSLLVVLSVLVFGFDKARSFLSKASGGCMPVNISETNLTSSSAEITFETDKACQVEIVYGTSNKAEALLLQIPEALPSLTHRIKLSPLLASTAYYYQIVADGQETGAIRSFLTMGDVVPTTAPAKEETYTYEEFKKHFYEDIPNPAFDVNKDNVVNEIDWRLYQKATNTP